MEKLNKIYCFINEYSPKVVLQTLMFVQATLLYYIYMALTVIAIVTEV